MEIKSINGRGYTPMAKSVNTMIKKTEKFLDTSLTRFVDGSTPIIMNYYSQDHLASVTGVGDKTTFGPYSGATKYKVVKDFIGYGYTDEKNTTTERNDKEDLKTDLDTLSFLCLPNTIIPTPGDRLTLELENHQIFYTVISIDQTTLHNRSFYKCDYKKDDNVPSRPLTLAHMIKEKLISNELIFVQENIGTEYSPFLEEANYKKLLKFTEHRYDLNEIYMSYFYDDYTNMLRSKDGEYYQYTPLLYYLQMEYFPLKIYESNDLMLSNEAVFDKTTVAKWKVHPLRKFLERRSIDGINDPITLYEYTYSFKQTAPYYKINSYMNSMDLYKVYDITPGDSKKAFTVELPPELLKIFTKWYHDDIENIDVFNNFLDDYFVEEINMSNMIFVPILLIIMDKVYDMFYTRYSINRFY